MQTWWSARQHGRDGGGIQRLSAGLVRAAPGDGNLGFRRTTTDMIAGIALVYTCWATSSFAAACLGFGRPLYRAGFIVGLLGAGLFGVRLSRRRKCARKDRTATARDALAEDSRAPVLYLRSFKDELVERRPSLTSGAHATDEEQMWTVLAAHSAPSSPSETQRNDG